MRWYNQKRQVSNAETTKNDVATLETQMSEWTNSEYVKLIDKYRVPENAKTVTPIKGAIIGGVIAGGAGAIISSRKETESIKSKLITHDTRELILDYFTIFYGLRFVKKLQNREIARLLGKSPSSINNVYERENWEYDNDYKKNQIMYTAHVSELQKRRQNGIREVNKLNLSVHKQLKQLIENPENMRTFRKVVSRGTCGKTFANYEELIKQIYYFIMLKTCLQKICVK